MEPNEQDNIGFHSKNKTALLNKEESLYLKKFNNMQLSPGGTSVLKTVAWDLNDKEQMDDLQLKIHVEIKEKKSIDIKSPRNKHSSLYKGKQSFEGEGCTLEIIDAHGNISKQKIKKESSEKINKEFNETVRQKETGEFLKAQLSYDKEKEKDNNDDIEDYVEDIKTNTVRNQFVGKMEVTDSGRPHAPLKKPTNLD